MSPSGSTGSPIFRNKGSPLLSRLVYVAFFIEVGLLLIVLPWSTYWERNYFLQLSPDLATLLTSNYLRGAISGLGFLDLVAGLAELMPMFRSRVHRDVAAGGEIEP